MKKWQCLITNSYSLKNLISTTAEYSNLCQVGIKSPVHLGITVKCNDSAAKCNGSAVKCNRSAVKCNGSAVKCNGSAVKCYGSVVKCNEAVR